MTRLRIELQDDAMLAAIDRCIEALQHPAELMQEIGARLEKKAEHRFDSKTDPTGAPWAPLSPVTVNYWYAIKYPDGIPGSLLDRTRQLRASLSYNSGDDWLEVGTSRTVPGKSQPFWEVGLLHEFGTAKMPRRGILTADPKTGRLGAGDEADTLAIVQSYLRGALGLG